MRTLKYLVHGQPMIIRCDNGRTWRGMWTDKEGKRCSWPFGSVDPRPSLEKIELQRKKNSAWGTLSCTRDARSQLRDITALTGEKHVGTLARLSLQEEHRLAGHFLPEPHRPELRVDPNASIKATWETVARLEGCASLTQERVGHLVARLIAQEWQRLFTATDIYVNTTYPGKASTHTDVSTSELQEAPLC